VRRAAHIFLEVCVAGASECVNTSVSADSDLNEPTADFKFLIQAAAVSSSPRLQHVISVRYRVVVSLFSRAVAQTSGLFVPFLRPPRPHPSPRSSVVFGGDGAQDFGTTIAVPLLSIPIHAISGPLKAATYSVPVLTL